MNECLFCAIAAGKIPSNKVYEDDRILAFNDISPAAPVHILFIPKEHTASSMNDINSGNSTIISYIFEKIAQVCHEKGIESYRVINNCGPDAGQTVSHLHFHVLAGRTLSELG